MKSISCELKTVGSDGGLFLQVTQNKGKSTMRSVIRMQQHSVALTKLQMKRHPMAEISCRNGFVIDDAAVYYESRCAELYHIRMKL